MKKSCDTFICMSNSSKDGTVIFGKNSDRPSDEAQLLCFNTKRDSEEKKLQCTHISIEENQGSCACFLSQPYWMFGAEMGANEFGVIIGNEAVWTKEPMDKIGLLGMDLLRLGLERGKTSKEALDVIINLLEKYGQGGSCSNEDFWTYHNSFLIADSNNGFILETAGKWWIVEIIKNVRAISNCLTIRGKGDFRKSGIIEYAVQKGYCKSEDEFDFAKNFSQYWDDELNQKGTRLNYTQKTLEQNIGKIDFQLVRNILRDHTSGICMHGGFESTASQISILFNQDYRKNIHFFNQTCQPCLSLFIPFNFGIKYNKNNFLPPYKEVSKDWFWTKYTNYVRYITKQEKEKLEKKIGNFEIEIDDKIQKLILLKNNELMNIELEKINYEILDYIEKNILNNINKK